MNHNPTSTFTCSRMALFTSELEGLAFYIKCECHFVKNVEFTVSKLQTHFFKDFTFFSHNTFSILNLFELIFALLTFRDKGVRVLGGPFLRLKILRYAQNFQWVQNFIFPNGKHISSQLADKFLKFEEMKYLIHHVKFEMWPAFCKFPILFSKVKLKLGNNFSQFINSYSKLYFKVFLNPQRDRKLGFLNVALTGLLNFS